MESKIILEFPQDSSDKESELSYYNNTELINKVLALWTTDP